MSLILDALRKSERTRQQTLSGRVSAAGSPRDHGRVPVPWATLIGLLLIANVIVLGVIFWRSRAPAQAAPAPVPVTLKSEANAPVVIYRPAVRSLAAEAAATGLLAATGAAAGPTLALPPAVSPSAVVAPVKNTPVPAVVAATTSVPTAGDTVTGADVPPLDSLPLAFQQSLPALHLDVHSYSSNPANRFVVINMQRYTKGDQLTAGPTVVAIVANGVILEYHGQKFLLPRP